VQPNSRAGGGTRPARCGPEAADGATMTLDGENELARHRLSGDRTLVWRDDGSPYDNTLHVYVLAADGSIIDALEAGAAFTTNILAFRSEGPDVFDFSFFANDKFYRLKVDQEPSLRMPFRLPLGFRYKSALGRHVISVTMLKE
jgi:hypothetical protein